MPALVSPGSVPSSSASLCLCLSLLACFVVFVRDLCTHDIIACLLVTVGLRVRVHLMLRIGSLYVCVVSCVFIVYVCYLLALFAALYRSFWLRRGHSAAKWLNDGVDAGATILVMSVALERRAAFSLVCVCVCQRDCSNKFVIALVV